MTKIKLPKGILKDIIIVVIGVLIIWMGLRVVFGTENPFYVVSSGSMVPELQIFDVLVVQGNDPFESVKIGDIIVFNRPSGQDRVIVHRVTSITNEDPFTIRTKGDANPTSIPGTDFPITEEEYIGKVAYVIPQVGYITRVLTPPINYIIIAIIISVMVGRSFLNRKKKPALSDAFDFESKDENNQLGEELGNLDIPEDKVYSKEIKKIENSETKFDNERSSELIDDEEIKSENDKK
ncbi:MAG: signal peptidase I [Thaumarchaeota archaeon]|nr:signal peptidase I [Nitrososphaerota archaeon]